MFSSIFYSSKISDICIANYYFNYLLTISEKECIKTCVTFSSVFVQSNSWSTPQTNVKHQLFVPHRHSDLVSHRKPLSPLYDDPRTPSMYPLEESSAQASVSGSGYQIRSLTWHRCLRWPNTQSNWFDQLKPWKVPIAYITNWLIQMHNGKGSWANKTKCYPSKDACLRQYFYIEYRFTLVGFLSTQVKV